MSRESLPVPGRFWRWLSIGLIAALAIVAAATFRDYGMSWDEPVQNTYGEELLAFYGSGFRDRDALSYMNLYFYGGFFDLVAATLNRLLPFDTYDTRHLWGAVLFLAGLVAAQRLATLFAGPRAGFFAVAVLGINALLYGHSFINPKDAPLAWLALWTIYFAARAIVDGNPRTVTLIGFAVSLGLTVGTRIIGVAMVGAIAAGLIVGVLTQRSPASHPLGRAALGLMAALPLAYAVMLACWPWAIQDPLNPIAALLEFSSMPSQGTVLWNGHMVSTTDVPWNYLLVLLGAQLPEHLLVGLVLAALAGGARLARRGEAVVADPRVGPLVIVIVAALGPIIGFIVLRPMAYNGMRHFLFVVPFLGILAALGWDAALSVAARYGRAATISVLAVFALGAAITISMLVRVHPYGYVAYNSLVGGLRGADGRFELDYWNVSFAEGARKLAAHLAAAGESSAALYVCGNRDSAFAFLPQTVRHTYKIEEADYLISTTPHSCSYLPVDQTRDRVVEVIREGAVLSYVVDLRPQRGPS
jgi:hypothetical protein